MSWDSYLEFNVDADYPDSNGWTVPAQTSYRTIAKGGLRVNDTSTAGSTTCIFAKTQTFTTASIATMEAVVECVASSGGSGVFLEIDDGTRGAWTQLFPGSVSLVGATTVSLSVDMTSPKIVTLQKSDVDEWKAWVDGILIGAVAGTSATSNRFAFGAGQSSSTSESYWYWVRHADELINPWPKGVSY